VAAVRIYGNGIASCPALEWDGSRYWCRLCRMPGNLGSEYRKELAVGEGCCCGLNTDRANIPPPVPKAEDIPQLPKELVAVLRALGGEFMSSDALHLALMRAERILDRPGFARYCFAVVTESRPKGIGEFMG
jgi:hypothetical protein